MGISMENSVSAEYMVDQYIRGSSVIFQNSYRPNVIFLNICFHV